ncbi:MAG TPA: class I SAM-dependent methyltransferase [Candidatus Saccharimonadales bacterium]|nr:class I SAM-dependent methyltransferase [Candidatus Saccharimonadales bacterium]
MPAHFRDYADPRIDEYRPAILEPENDDKHRRLVRHGERLLSVVGKQLDDSADGQRWQFPRFGKPKAVIEIREPKIVIPAMLEYADVGLFYTHVEGMWGPDIEATPVPDDVETGNPESDAMVMVAVGLQKAVRPIRKHAWARSRRHEEENDAKSIAAWTPSAKRTKQEIADHYDLTPEVYTGEYGFLDQKYVQYSSGLLAPSKTTESLEAMQEHKVTAIADNLWLDTADTLIEIGGGWGGLAVALAERNPGLRITSLTVSHEQLLVAQQKAIDAGVADQIDFREEDYRDHQPEKPYDRLVSIEMLEAVDWRDHDDYFNHINKFLAEDGRALLQAIHIHSSQWANQKHARSFANTAIFPGGVLTPKDVIRQKMAERGLQVVGQETELGSSYAQTLREWRRNLEASRAALTGKWRGEGRSPAQIERFYRGFGNIYLAWCQAGFMPQMNNIQASQMTFRRAG